MQKVHEDIFKPEQVMTDIDDKGAVFHSVKRWNVEQEALVHGRLTEAQLKEILSKNKIKDRINKLLDKCRSVVTSFNHNNALTRELKV